MTAEAAPKPTSSAPSSAELPADLALYRVLRDDDTANPDTMPELDDEALMRLYRHMLRIRLIDERMLMRQRQGRVGFYGASTGQEATPIGTAFCLEEQDWVFPALREASIMLVRGFPLTTWLAQIYGNSGDVNKGRQQPMHMAGKAVKQVSWSSCLGPQLPQAVGAAWAAKIRGDKDVVTVGFTGDGATSEPDFHSAMNFAGVYKPPVVIICQNNHWAISVPSSKQTASQTFAVKGRAYGVDSVRVDGNDVLAIISVVGEALAKARRGDGPTFIEAVTYRIGAHSSSDDPRLYRDEAEVEVWKKKDPIERFERFLTKRGLLTIEGKEELSKELLEGILAAIREVESFDPPSRETVLTDVYAEAPWHLKEQLAELLSSEPAPKGH